MSGLRTSRTRLAGAAATVALAALALTACDDGTGVESEGTRKPTGPTATAPASSSGASASASSAPKAPSAPAGTSVTDPAAPTAHTPASGRPAPSGTPVTCEGSTTRTVATPLSRPVNHLLLTVTNTGGKSCHLYGYPAVRFGEAQAVPPAIEDSRPQAVVTLGPGESGYASVNLSAADGSSTDGHTVHSLTVYFHGRSGGESVGTGAHPPLPSQGVRVDDSLAVTYWQQSLDDAVRR